METISPRTPATSVTPVGIAHAYILPPLTTLPTWNRNKFNAAKILQPVQRNKHCKVELIGQIDKIENSTQTSPPNSSILSASPAKHPLLYTVPSKCQSEEVQLKQCTNSDSCDKLEQSFRKKIVFLEAAHKEVLSGLQRELDKVKSQNKALQFQIVISEKDPNESSLEELNAENIQLRKSLHEADSKIFHQSTLIKQLRRDPSKRPSAIKFDGKRKSSLRKKLKQLSVHINDTNSAPFDRGNEQGHPPTSENHSLGKLNCVGSNITFPKLVNQVTRGSASGTNSYCPVTKPSKKMEEPISLPTLQTRPSLGNGDFRMRQKRANVLHLKRQRSNKTLL